MNSENPDLSVVVPYFNQPEQLREALADLRAQKNIRLQVIVVDDISDKPCGTLVEEFQKTGLDITLLRQERRSYTLAGRLRGMCHAKGRWLAFMDADDRVVSDTAYSRAVREAEDAAVDILHFQVLGIDRKGFISHRPQAGPFHEGRLEGEEIFSAWANAVFAAHSVWNKLYSRTLYTKIAALKHDLKIVRIEDFYLSTYFMFFARSYASSSLAVYKYYLPAETHLAKVSGRAFDALRMFWHLPARFREFGLPPELGDKLQGYLKALMTINGGRLCGFLPDSIWKSRPFELDFSSPQLGTVLEYGTREEFLLLLIAINASNVAKLRDLKALIVHE